MTSTGFCVGNSCGTLNFLNEASMKFGVILKGVAAIEDMAAEPLSKAAATVIPNNAKTQGIIIPQIAPVDKPLLLFL